MPLISPLMPVAQLPLLLLGNNSTDNLDMNYCKLTGLITRLMEKFSLRHNLQEENSFNI